MSVRKNSFPPTDIVGDLWSVALKVVKWNKSSCWVVFFWRSCLEYLIRSSTPIPSTYGCYHCVLQAEVEVDLLQSLWRSVRRVPLSLPSARSSTFVCRFCLQAAHILSISIGPHPYEHHIQIAWLLVSATFLIFCYNSGGSTNERDIQVQLCGFDYRVEGSGRKTGPVHSLFSSLWCLI